MNSEELVGLEEFLVLVRREVGREEAVGGASPPLELADGACLERRRVEWWFCSGGVMASVVSGYFHGGKYALILCGRVFLKETI